MKKFQIFLMSALAMLLMTSCLFKTEATVDVEVLKNGQPQSGVAVYRFNNDIGEGATIYKDNAKAVVTTNAGGVAHFALKSPDDMDPSSVTEDVKTFFFCTFDAENHRNGFVAVQVKSGDKKTVQLVMEN